MYIKASLGFITVSINKDGDSGQCLMPLSMLKVGVDSLIWSLAIGMYRGNKLLT